MSCKDRNESSQKRTRAAKAVECDERELSFERYATGPLMFSFPCSNRSLETSRSHFESRTNSRRMYASDKLPNRDVIFRLFFPFLLFVPRHRLPGKCMARCHKQQDAGNRDLHGTFSLLPTATQCKTATQSRCPPYTSQNGWFRMNRQKDPYA